MKDRRTVIDFVVVGSGEFPIDMLRYDSAWPATEPESYKVRCDYTVPHTQRRREVRLSMAAPLGKTGPTIGRWKSFGWNVTFINGEPQ